MDQLVTCRTCLIKKGCDKCIVLTSEATYNSVPVLSLLKVCIPEMDIDANTSICIECIDIISNFYEFKNMCLENSSKYSNLVNVNCLGKSNNIIYSDVPPIESDITCTSKDILSNKVRNLDLGKNPNTIVDKSDVNQNETSKNLNTCISKVMKMKRFPFYRNRFMNSKCLGCKNRILDVKYHSRVFTGFYDCFNCGKRLTSIDAMRKHIYNHTLSYKCDICDKSWRGRYALEIHLRSHTKQKPFECPVCNKRFVQSYSLHEHLGIHQGHDDNNKNRCSICDKVLSTKYNLKIHMTMHNSASKPRCPKCNKWFYTVAAVQKHAVTCSLKREKEENEETFNEPEFIKSEIPDSIKEELEDDIFVEEPSSSIIEYNKLEKLKSEFPENNF